MTFGNKEITAFEKETTVETEEIMMRSKESKINISVLTFKDKVITTNVPETTTRVKIEGIDS